MEFRDLRLALHRHWALALTALAVCLAVGAAAAFLPEKTYRATATILATPDPGASGNLVQTAAFQIPAVIETLQSRSFVGRVGGQLPPDVDRAIGVAAVSDVGTGIIRLSVEGADPQSIASWANALAGTLVADTDAQAIAAAADDAVPAPLLDLQVLDEARPPQVAASPKPAPILLGSAVLAVLAAVLTALIASRATKALDIGEELRRRLDAPILAQLPVARRLRRADAAVDDLLLDGPPQLVEALQSFRTNVELAFHAGRPEALAVSSWNSGEGKSTVVAGLALALANVGRDVVVVDADLRRPSMHIKLSEPFGEGLADAGRIDATTLVRATRHLHLDFLPAGIPDRHPADVLAVALPRAADALARTGRLVLIDAPPIHGVAEAPLILSVARNLILVVDARNTNLLELEQAVQRLRASGVTLVGVVVNRTRKVKRVRTYAPFGMDKQSDQVSRLGHGASDDDRHERVPAVER